MSAVTTTNLILYDGACGLCNRLNLFVLPRDRADIFRFASLQSRLGRNILQKYGKHPGDMDTLYVVSDYESARPKLLSKTPAVLFILKAIGEPWKLSALLGILPTRLLNWAYDFIARHRYRIFGRSESCLIPNEHTRRRFLDLGSGRGKLSRKQSDRLHKTVRLRDQ